MDNIINVKLMSNPTNWVLVTLMAFMFAMVLDLFSREIQ